jgi:hypothetical protein
MRFKYAERKLAAAARTLQSEIGTVQQRLHDAFTLHLARLDSRDLPEELRAAFAELQEVAASTRPVSAECADRCVALLVNLKNCVATVACPQRRVT